MAKLVDNTVRESLPSHASEPPVPRHSGFVTPTYGAGTHGAASQNRNTNGHAQPQLATPTNVGDAILQANAELDQSTAPHLTAALALAIGQRDRFIAQLWQEREAWQQEFARQLAAFGAQAQERETAMHQVVQQLQAAQREISYLREAAAHSAKTPVEEAVANLAIDTGEPTQLQVALEAAWQDVQDTRARLAALEQERDNAVKEVDELRVELYGKLEAAQDEVIVAEGRLGDAQRAFDEAKEAWESEQARLRAEAEEAKQALLMQLEVNTHLRNSILPPVQTSAPGLEDLGNIALPLLGPQAVPLVTPASPRPPIAEQASSMAPYSSPSGSNFATSHAPPAPVPHFPTSMGHQRSLSALVGFETSPPVPSDDESAFASTLESDSKRPKGFGLGRLFRSK